MSEYNNRQRIGNIGQYCPISGQRAPQSVQRKQVSVSFLHTKEGRTEQWNKNRIVRIVVYLGVLIMGHITDDLMVLGVTSQEQYKCFYNKTSSAVFTQYTETLFA